MGLYCVCRAAVSTPGDPTEIHCKKVCVNHIKRSDSIRIYSALVLADGPWVYGTVRWTQIQGNKQTNKQTTNVLACVEHFAKELEQTVTQESGENWREKTQILCGSVDLERVKAQARALIPARLKLWANQAWNREQRDSRDWRALDSHCLSLRGVCVCVLKRLRMLYL